MNDSLRRNSRRLVVAAACLVILVVALWYVRQRASREPLSKVEEITARLTSADLDALTPATRRDRWHEWHRELENLPPRLKHEFWSARNEHFHAWLQEFRRASREEQAALLKEILESINEFRTTWEPTSGGRPSWWDDLNAVELEKRQQQWLSLAEPEERAMVNAFLQMLAAEALQLGLATTPSPWGDDAPT
jgi:hypothetical protein